MMFDQKDLIVPPRLMPGDTVGIIAPAGPFDQGLFYKGIQVLKSMGFDVKVPEDLFLKTDYLAGSDTHRAQLLQRLFEDPTVKAVICARGGYGSMRILDLIDYAMIRSSSKVLIGFSDVSALLATIYSKSGLVTFHGPVVTTFSIIDQASIDAVGTAVSTNNPVVLVARNGAVISPGVATGPVLPGNLTTLCHLTGTPFQPLFKGHILLLEDTGEAPYRIDRMLTQLRLAGCLEGLEGLALGTFENCGRGEEIQKIVENIFEVDQIPILAGMDFGHGSRNITIPVGLTATLDAERQRLIYHRPATNP